MALNFSNNSNSALYLLYTFINLFTYILFYIDLSLKIFVFKKFQINCSLLYFNKKIYKFIIANLLCQYDLL